jgi:hypothetical protein
MKKLLLLGTAVLVTNHAFASSDEGSEQKKPIGPSLRPSFYSPAPEGDSGRVLPRGQRIANPIESGFIAPFNSPAAAPARAPSETPDPIHSDDERRIIREVGRLTTTFQDLVNQAISIRSVSCIEALQEWSRKLARFHPDNTLNALTDGRYANWGSVYDEAELLKTCDQFVTQKYNEQTSTIFKFISLLERAIDIKNFYVISNLRHWCEGQEVKNNIIQFTRRQFKSWNDVLHEAGFNDRALNDATYRTEIYAGQDISHLVNEFIKKPFENEPETVNLFISLVQRAVITRNKDILFKLRNWLEVTDPETGDYIQTFTKGLYRRWSDLFDMCTSSHE